MLAFYFLFGFISFSNGVVIMPPEESLEFYKPGCHKIGNTRTLNVQDCVPFDVTTNACRGFCESWAIPTDPRVTHHIPQPITSTASCCSIMHTEPVETRVLCKEGMRAFVFKSAVNCSCFHCSKD